MSSSYTCGSCPKSFSSHAALQQHIASGIHNPTYTCNDCNRSFTSDYGLQEHFQSSKKHNHHCKDCNKRFDTRASLQQHFQHAAEHNHTCSRCSRTFGSRLRLGEHVCSVPAQNKMEGHVVQPPAGFGTWGWGIARSNSTPPVVGGGFNALPAPAPGFGATTSAFTTPASGFGAPASGFGAPASGFGAPASRFGAPASGFGASAPGFGANTSPFTTPTPGFAANTSPFTTPASFGSATSVSDFPSPMRKIGPTTRPKKSQKQKTTSINPMATSSTTLGGFPASTSDPYLLDTPYSSWPISSLGSDNIFDSQPPYLSSWLTSPTQSPFDPSWPQSFDPVSRFGSDLFSPLYGGPITMSMIMAPTKTPFTRDTFLIGGPEG